MVSETAEIECRVADAHDSRGGMQASVNRLPLFVRYEREVDLCQATTFRVWPNWYVHLNAANATPEDQV